MVLAAELQEPGMISQGLYTESIGYVRVLACISLTSLILQLFLAEGSCKASVKT